MSYNGNNKYCNDMKNDILEILQQHKLGHIPDEQALNELLNLFSVSGSATLKDERWRIWIELCKGETDGAFASTLELEADDIHEMIFKGKEIKL